jgi:hypothetical protein
VDGQDGKAGALNGWPPAAVRFSVEFPIANFCFRAQTRDWRVQIKVMFKRFGQIFWGLLLVILDFNINHVDILPYQVRRELTSGSAA